MTAARIALLGRVGIDQDGRPSGRGLPGRRAELVFAYLAAEHDRAVSRDALADALWPYALPDTWAAALRGVVTEVRRFLEDAGLDPADVLVSANGGYELRLPPGVRVDLDEARAAFRHARERLAADAPAEAAERAERAAALARRPFLPQHEGDWVDGVRDELASLHVRALELEARAHALAGDRDGTADATERLVRAEPYSETLHQLRIRLLGELGDRAASFNAGQ
ncbi:MAG: BTAD domain-containing putative transcriptional regulator, partial [Solirubrobacteraceae bacterium]